MRRWWRRLRRAGSVRDITPLAFGEPPVRFSYGPIKLSGLSTIIDGNVPAGRAYVFDPGQVASLPPITLEALDEMFEQMKSRGRTFEPRRFVVSPYLYRRIEEAGGVSGYVAGLSEVGDDGGYGDEYGDGDEAAADVAAGPPVGDVEAEEYPGAEQDRGHSGEGTAGASHG